MVKIRYADLPAGLHVTVESDGHGTVIYLLPGLTSAQRHAALIRARRSARMGTGPALPAIGLARAVAADQVRTTVGNGAAALRRHPVLVLAPLIVLVSSAIVFGLTSFVTLTMPQQRKVSATVSAPPLSEGSANPSKPVPGARHHRSASPPGHDSRTGLPSASSSAARTPGDPAPRQSPSPAPSTFQSPSPTPTPSPTPSPSPTGTCINLGVIGVCLNT